MGLRGIGAQSVSSKLPVRYGCSGPRWRLVDIVTRGKGERGGRERRDIRINKEMVRFEMIDNIPLSTGSSRHDLRIRK